MVDIQLFVPKSDGPNWCLDIDIVNGQARLLETEEANLAQRAAVGAYMIEGSVPGLEVLGINWPGLFTEEASIVDIDNQTKQQIQNFAKSELLQNAPISFMPIYDIKESDVGIQLFSLGGA